uniref:Uncharacterized protein n=1 Tax=Mantoniella antarctica TaxID=81844 RepID=A0A7S0X787_9CHLO|mmetsp:Transcript_24790/g.61816  ORF Transcript_24790/g.61816 Transcript_24790/m.61816 type:complete len:171 (+) Transcript_24790:90-602(+)
MVRGRNWSHQVCWMVVQKSVILGLTPREIERDLEPSGPAETTIHQILQRFRHGVALTGRGRARRCDRALQGDDLLLFMRLIINNPLSFLDELQSGLASLTIQGVFDGRRISTSVLCSTMQELGITRRKLYTLSHHFCELKRMQFWTRYQLGYTIDMCTFLDDWDRVRVLA